MATANEDLERDAGRRFAPAQMAAVLGGLLVVAFLLWFFLLRSDAEPESNTASPEVSTDATPEPVPTPGDKKRAPVETFEVFAPKDPFDPLVSASAAAVEGSATDGTTTSDSDGAIITTSDDGTGTTTTTTTDSGDGGEGSSESVGGHRVRLIDVFQENGEARAQIQVDGTVYTVSEGERFAQNFQLVSTSGSCGTMLYGDDQFTLCEGEEILK